MLKKYSRVFVTGDLHLGDVRFKYEDKLVETIRNNKFDCLIFGGDTFDLWRSKGVEDLMTKYNSLFKLLKKVNGDVIFIRGNHDQDIDALEKHGFIVADSFSYINATDQQVQVIHGHEFDRAVVKWEFFLRRLVYIEEKINKALLKIDDDFRIRWAGLIRNRNVRKVLRNLYRTLDSFSHNDVLMFGHMHVPCVGTEKDLCFYNWGSWQRHFGLQPSYLIDSADGVQTHRVVG